MAGICHLASGFNTGNVPETECSEMRAKRVIFWGFRLQKGGEKGVFGASKDAKKALFGVREGSLAGEEGFSGQNRTLCQCQRPAQIHPPGRCYA
jgi:hypothetical protein